MLSHITQPIIKFFSNLAYYLLIFAIILSVLSLIYIGIRMIIEKRNYQDIKSNLLFIIIAILIFGLILINRDIIFDVIKLFVPKF